MTKSLSILLMAIAVFYSSAASANSLIFKLKDVSVFAETAESFKVVSGKETIKLKRVSGQEFLINGKSLKWSEKDSMASLRDKAKNVYNKSKRKNALLEQLLIGEAHAIPFIFPLVLGGMLGLAGGQAMCDSGAGRSTASQPGE